MNLMSNLAEIVRIDRELQEVAGQRVVTLSDVVSIKRIKSDRSFHVRVLQNYKPAGVVN